MSALLLPPSIPNETFAPSVDSPVADSEFLRLSIDEYHQMIRQGILTTDHKVELLDGLLVKKMPKSRAHIIATSRIRRTFERLNPGNWVVISQEPVTLDIGEPEPDVVVTIGYNEDDPDSNPRPEQIAVLVEVSDSSLRRDKNWKLRMYARNGIANYWIANLVDGVLEVYANPINGEYLNASVLTRSENVELVIAGTAIASIPVADLIPDAA